RAQRGADRRGADQSQADPGEAQGGVAQPRHARPCAGHPRLSLLAGEKSWMAGTSPAMTELKSRLREQPRVVLGGDRGELTGGRIAHRQAPARDTKIGAVDGDPPRLDQLAQARKRKQIGGAVANLPLLEPYQIFGFGK